MNESIDFTPFIASHPAMWSVMAAQAWNSLDGLQAPAILSAYRPDVFGWEALLELRHVGPRRVLDLVNFIRDRGVELPWFADWDLSSANWTALEGCRRADPVKEE